MKYLVIFMAFLISADCLGQVIPAPTGLKALWNDDTNEISLSWDSLEFDIAGYHLYVKRPDQPKYVLWAKLGLIFNTETKFSSISTNGGTYEFMVTGFNNFPDRVFGETSMPVKVLIPSSFLPIVGDIEIKIRKRNAEIMWDYPTGIDDLAGFILSINGTEYHIDLNVRTHQISELTEGNYQLSIVSYNKSGLRSEQSVNKLFVVK